jgi:hypothetical protein
MEMNIELMLAEQRWRAIGIPKWCNSATTSNFFSFDRATYTGWLMRADDAELYLDTIQFPVPRAVTYDY